MTAIGAVALPSAGTGDRTAGLAVMTRFLLRRDRIKLPAWVGGLGLAVVYVGTAVPRIAPTPADLDSVTSLFTQPVGRLFTGPAFGMDQPTYARFFAVGYAPYLFLAAGLMNILLVIRHTRAEEQSGRAELLRATVTGRHTALTAALIVAAISDLLAAAVVTVCAVAVGFTGAGSVLIGVGAGLTGMAFAGIAATCAQLTEYSRTAAGLAGAALGVAFVLRGLGDMVAVGGSALTWASPLGWAAQTAPYVDNRWAPLLPLLALAIIAIAVAYLLQARRDLGAGLLAARPGPAEASPALGTPFGLAARLQRGGLAGWGAAIVLLGVVDGAFAQALIDAGASLPGTLRTLVEAGSGLVTGYLSFLGSFVAVLIAAYTVFAAQTLRAEEIHGRASAVLATPTSRARWLGSHAVVMGLGAASIAALAGLGTGLAAAVVTGEPSLIGDGLAAHLGPVPAILLLLSIWIALIGWAPRAATPVGWTLVALAAVISFFGELLSLPLWLTGLSPFEHLAQLPGQPFAAAPFLVQIALAAAVAAIGLAGIRRREIDVV